MLDIALEGVTLRSLHALSVTFARSTHTAVVGPPRVGVSTLLRVIAGLERPAAGSVRMGTRDVTRLPTSARPLLYAAAELDVPGRWSVEHALVAAVRGRSLDREDRYRELRLSAETWQLDVGRRVSTLSDSERARLHLARIELQRPAVVIADRLLRDSAVDADAWYRLLRVIGATVISAPAHREELGLTDRIVVLEGGVIVQDGSAAAVYLAPVSEAAARSTGEVNAIPVLVRGTSVESPIGSWTATSPFQGAGLALMRPSAFAIAAAGEESDFIFCVEEASFASGRWIARGLVTGGGTLTVELPAREPVFKGRPLPLRYDRSSTVLVRG